MQRRPHPSPIMKQLDDPIDALWQRLQAARDTRMVVGLVGLPGAGKSTCAQQWTRAIHARCAESQMLMTMQTVGMDGFHLSRAALSQLPDPELALARRGAEWTFDPAGLRARLQALRCRSASGEYAPVSWPGFDHAIGDPVAAALTVEASTRLVLVEGLYLLLPDADWALKPLFDEVWFLDIDMSQAQEQLIQRHMRAWGWDHARAQARAQASDALNAQRVWATRALADAWVRP